MLRNSSRLTLVRSSFSHGAKRDYLGVMHNRLVPRCRNSDTRTTRCPDKSIYRSKVRLPAFAASNAVDQDAIVARLAEVYAVAIGTFKLDGG